MCIDTFNKLSIGLGTLLVGIGTMVLSVSSCIGVTKYTINIENKKIALEASKSLIDTSQEKIQTALTSSTIQNAINIIEQLPIKPLRETGGLVPPGVYINLKDKEALLENLRAKQNKFMQGQILAETPMKGEIFSQLNLQYAPPD